MLIRPMSPRDLPGVLAVQQLCYAPDFLEPPAAFASKLDGAADTCWVADDGTDAMARIHAYLVCLPVDAHSLPALHAAQWRRPAQARWLYLHDLAVGPQARGQAMGPRLVAQARQQAQALGLQQLVLVAVQDSVGFWSRLGFAEQPLPTGVARDKLASFGTQARFMAAEV